MIFRFLHFQRCLLHRLSGALLTMCVLVSATVTRAEADYTFTLIADSTGPFRDFGASPSPSINAVGTVAFNASLDNGKFGVFTGNGAITTTVVQSTSSNFPLVYGSFGRPGINLSGSAVFLAYPEGGIGEGIFVGNGGPLVTIADTAGQFQSFASGYSTSINSAGTVAFWALPDTGPAGIFASNGGTVTPLFLNSGSLNANNNIAFNDVGTLAFRKSNATGIVTVNSGSVTTIVDTSGPLNYFGAVPSLNSNGTVAFVAGMNGVNGSVSGVYKGNGGALTTIADLSGPFNSFGSFNSGHPSINDAGAVAFLAGLDTGGFGIYTGDGTGTSEVIGSGGTLFGSSITALQISPTSLNDSGQVAFYYELANGTTGIAIANPVPEPSASLLLALSFGLSLACRTTLKC